MKTKNSNRVNRGGSWSSFARDCRSASRGAGSPSGRFSSLGFRLVIRCETDIEPPTNGKIIDSTDIEGLKYDDGKPQYTLLPPKALRSVVDVLTFGAQKYGAENWNRLTNLEQRYLDAVFRHIEAHRSGEYRDMETTLPHLAHAITSLLFILQYHYDSEKTQSESQE